MKRVIYCSQATHEFTSEELIALLQTSRTRNEAAGLTGMLMYCRQSFLQMLEGDEAALDATYSRIVADRRHDNLRLLMSVEVEAPLFADWSMGFEHVNDEQLAGELEGYTPQTKYPLLNPDVISNGAVAQTLLTMYRQNKVGQNKVS